MIHLIYSDPENAMKKFGLEGQFLRFVIKRILLGEVQRTRIKMYPLRADASSWGILDSLLLAFPLRVMN